MKYDFDKVVDRHNISSVKWDLGNSSLPMWVADMDFMSPPEVIRAFKKRIDQGTFGYTYVDDKWYDSYIHHWKKLHNFKIEKEWLIFSTGVIASISSIVRRLTEIGNNVLLLTPIYNTFFNSIINNGRHPLESKMIYENGEYRIDFDDLEEKLKLEETALFIFCNPHNPIGKVWTKEEMKRIGELCNKYHVKVISDEIHCDLVKPNIKYTPFMSVSEINKRITVMTIAPTKTFNLAGIQTSAIVVADPYLKHKVERGLNTDECAEPNVLALEAPKICFNKCDEWLKELNEYIDDNRKYVRSFIEEYLKGKVKMVEGDALYLLWLDFSAITDNTTIFGNFLKEKTGLYLASGEIYRGDGLKFMRMNVATQKERVIDAMERLKKGITLFLNEKSK